MSDRIEIQGKTVSEAVSEALLKLGARKDEVEITVLEEPKKGLLGLLGGRPARVLVRRKPAARRGGRDQDYRENQDGYSAHDLSGGSGGRRSGRGRGSGRGDAPRNDAPRKDAPRKDAPRGEGQASGRDGGSRRGGRGRREEPARDARAPRETREPREPREARSGGSDAPARDNGGPRDDNQAPRERSSRRRRGGRGRGRGGRGRGEGAPRDAEARTQDQPTPENIGNTLEAGSRQESVSEPVRERVSRSRRNDGGRDRGPRRDEPRRDEPRQDEPRQAEPSRSEAVVEEPRRERQPAAVVSAPPVSEARTEAPARPVPAAQGAPDQPLASDIKGVEYAKPIRDVADEDIDQTLNDLANGMLLRAGFPCRVEVKPGEYRQVRVITDDASAGMLIGRHGAAADAVEHLVERMSSTVVGERVRLNLDINNYRRRREESLTGRVAEAVSRVRETGRDYHMEPMCARERRLIHLEAENVEGVRTYTLMGAGGKHVVLALDNGEGPGAGETSAEADTDTDDQDYSVSGTGAETVTVEVRDDAPTVAEEAPAEAAADESVETAATEETEASEASDDQDEADEPRS